MEAFKCDRCGRFYERTSHRKYLLRENINSSKILDLCANCNVQLNIWVSNEEENDESQGEL